MLSTYTTTYDIGGRDVDVSVAYQVQRGYRACFNDPGEPNTVEVRDIKISRDGVPLALPGWLEDQIIEDLDDELLSAWADGLEYAREQAADAKREERMGL